MMRDLVEAMIAFSAVVALCVCCKQRLSTQVNYDRLAFWGIFCVTFGGFIYDLSYMPKGQFLQLALVGVLAVFVLMQLLRSSRNKEKNDATTTQRSVAWAAPMLAVVLFLVNAIMNPGLPLIESLGRLLSVVFLLLIVIFCVSSRMSIHNAAAAILAAVLSVLVIASVSGNSWRACDQFKCGPFGAIYTGPFASENGLAILVGVGVLCTLCIWSGWTSFVVLIPLLLTIYATESRTSQLALITAVSTWLLLKLCMRVKSKSQLSFRNFWVLVVAGLMILGLFLTYTSSPSSFSNRGNVWIRGTRALGDNWIFGLGLERWTYLQDIGYMPPLFPHSQYLLILFSGGVLGLLVLFILFVGAIKKPISDVHGAYSFSVAYIVFLGVLGITEAYWNPLAVDSHTFLAIPLIVSAIRSTSTKQSAEAEPPVGRLLGNRSQGPRDC